MRGFFLGVLVATCVVMFVACGREPTATSTPPSTPESTGPETVRVQNYDDGPFHCRIFTHDSFHGSSIAAVCK